MRTLAFLAVITGAIVHAQTARAHLGLVSPPSRYGTTVLKYPPCGMTGGTRSTNVTVYEPGQTIEIVWDEYVDHPGHYRIAFDADGDDDFVDPATMMELDSNEAVLLDGIPDRDVTAGDSEYRVSVTLPDVECERCTLQVIQVMYDKPPYTIPGNDIYYQCADIVLRRTGVDAGPSASDAGPDVDSGSRPAPDAGGGARDAGGTTTTRRTEDGCCTVAPGARRDPLGALVVGLALASVIALRRRR